ncbi:MAG: universal stress protein [Crocinitomicaceae bacterium]|nr:universal stress protein [Crocinitomicaceae bacterium]
MRWLLPKQLMPSTHSARCLEKEAIKEAKEKLEVALAKAKSISRVKDVNIEAHVRVGNIFDDISDVSLELGAELIFMGTHGAHGWQHITGSHALKW